MTRASLAVVSAVLAASLAAPAAAGPHDRPLDDGSGAVEPTTAEDFLRLGLEHYEAGDYKAAVEAFQRGHAIDPRPQFLFAIAQAERLRGDCRAALGYYQRFLTTSPPEEQAEAARQQVRRCSAALVASQPVRRAEPAPPPRPVEPPPPAPARDPWWRDPVTLGAAGGALVLGATSAGFFLAADGAAGDAATAETYDEHVALEDRARRHTTTAVVTLAASGVVAGYAVYRILRGGERRTEPRVGVSAGPGVGLAIGGRF